MKYRSRIVILSAVAVVVATSAVSLTVALATRHDSNGVAKAEAKPVPEKPAYHSPLDAILRRPDYEEQARQMAVAENARQLVVAGCMTAKGFQYVVREVQTSDYVSSNSGAALPVDPSTQGFDLVDSLLSTRPVALPTGQVIGLLTMSASQRKAAGDALFATGGCNEAADISVHASLPYWMRAWAIVAPRFQASIDTMRDSKEYMALWQSWSECFFASTSTRFANVEALVANLRNALHKLPNNGLDPAELHNGKLIGTPGLTVFRQSEVHAAIEAAKCEIGISQALRDLQIETLTSLADEVVRAGILPNV
jgi:hypothetical protein